ncbi:hypothetical protein [Nocardia sp. NPDC058497]|uniref:hypothetical protein n=1 Tax=Nocardia sp. NPDC058497 TaxID=3346529 RepID=UPI00364F32BB
MPESTENDPVDAVRTNFRSVPLRELLHSEVGALLGVDTDAQDALSKLEITTVFDLATSATFDIATKLVRAGTNPGNPLFQHGIPPADMVKGDAAAGKRVADLQYLPINILEMIPAADAGFIESALDVTTVRDLAFYPPYISARRLMNAVYFPESITEFDPELPSDLLPKTGEFPTERVQYSTLLLDEIRVGDKDSYINVETPAFAPIDLAKLAKGDSGFQRVAYGALLTFNQSWYAHGVTLGQLLHSAALAPGESTRLAVIDWSRKSRAVLTERID